MLKIILLLAVLITVLTLGFCVWEGQQSLPTMEGMISLPKLQGTVSVYFDQVAVPYIQAGSEADLCLAQGYVTASERMFQMDMLRRTAQGTLSEIYGAECLGQDRLARTIGFNRLANIELRTLSSEARENLKAYCDGVNSYLERSARTLPLECLLLGYKPRAWQIQDTLAILKYLQYQLDESWQLDEVRTRIAEKGGSRLADELFQKLQMVTPPASTATGLNISMAPMPTSLLIAESKLAGKAGLEGSAKYLWGSNAWALAKNMTSSKGSMLACNKDSVFTFPDIWYQCSLQSSSFHVAGATIPGVPGVIIGRNENIGWAATSFKADVQDLFVEQFSEDNPDKYKVPGGWGEAFAVNEEIPIRFSGNSLERILITRHGPLLFKDKNKGVALSWTGEQVSKSIFETIWHLNKANNWSDFRNILKSYNGSPQNFLYADEKGNIGAQVAGNIPLRKCDQKLGHYILTAGTRILPGWIDDGLWVDRVAFEDMSSSFNAGDGFIVSGDPRHSMIATNSNSKSSERILGVLYQYKTMSKPLDLSQMSELQADQLAPFNELIASELERALLNTNSIDTYKQQALKMLKAWNGQLRADSPQGSLYESFVSTLLKRILEPKLGNELTNQYVERWPRWTTFVAKVMKEKPADLLPPSERSYDSFFLTTFAQSLKNVRVSFRSEEAKDWQWQKLHPIDFVSFAQEKLPKYLSGLITVFAPAKAQTMGIGGDQDSVNAASVDIAQAPWDFPCRTGSTERMLIDMADEDKFYQTLSLGQSGHLFSKNRNDQQPAWLKNEHYSIAFSSKQLRLQSRHTLILSNKEEKTLTDTN